MTDLNNICKVLFVSKSRLELAVGHMFLYWPCAKTADILETGISDKNCFLGITWYPTLLAAGGIPPLWKLFRKVLNSKSKNIGLLTTYFCF